MTTVQATGPRTIDVSGTPGIPFPRLLAVEFRKSYDTRSGFWLIVTIGGLIVLADAIATIVFIVKDQPGDFGAFIGIAAFLGGFLLPVLAIMLVTAEWSQRTAMVTFSLDPRRPQVIAAKFVVGLLLTLALVVVSIAAGAVCNLICAAAGNGVSWAFGWNYFFGFIIAQALAMAGGFALATLLLSTPAAIVAFFVYEWVLPIVFAIAAGFLGWLATASQWFNLQDAEAPLRDLSIHGSQWAHLIVALIIWLVVPLAIGLRRILSAEVK